MGKKEYQIKISVIVPVYNMSEYLAKAIESFLNQTLDEKELILVDDGSNDSSFMIAENYAKAHYEIIIIKQDHKGSGAARNLGIHAAKGEYVCFLDADDFYASEDVLDYLYKLAKRENAIICGGSSGDYIDGIVRTEGLRKERRFLREQYIQKENFPGVSGYWSFVFKKQFLINNKVFFSNYLRGQDAPFFAKAIACAGGVYCSDKLIYVYRKEHKIVQFDERKALDLARSYRDVYLISIAAHLIRIQNVVEEELKGELGALIYKYSCAGSKEMKKILQEINDLYGTKLERQNEKSRRLLYEGFELYSYVQRTEQEKKSFIMRLEKCDRIYIFGAGLIGNKVACFLENNHINIDSFVVSDISKNRNSVRGISVNSIDQVNINGNYIVIIATFWYAQNEIVNCLKKNGKSS